MCLFLRLQILDVFTRVAPPKLPSELVTFVDSTIKCFHGLSFFPHVAHKRLGHLWEVACIPRGLCIPLPSRLPLSGLRAPSTSGSQRPLTLFIHVPLRAPHMAGFLLHSTAHYTLSFSYPAPFQVCILFPLKDTDPSHNGFQVGNMKLKTFLHFPAPPPSTSLLCLLK